MTVGLSAGNLANDILDHLSGNATWTAPANIYYRMHTGDPGASGTANTSAVTTRVEVTFGAASSGVMTQDGTDPEFACSATESISHLSAWDNATAGNFLWSVQLSAAKDVESGDTLTITTSSLTVSPLAA